MTSQTEILFYHMTHKRLEDVLPSLLDACMTRDWRALVCFGSEERLEALDAHLWTYRNDAFLPHGTSQAKFADQQPILLTTSGDNPNAATVKFYTDGAIMTADAIEGFNRAVLIFDGQDEDALAQARSQWAALKKSGFTPTYWRQSEAGRWEKQVLN